MGVCLGLVPLLGFPKYSFLFWLSKHVFIRMVEEA